MMRTRPRVQCMLIFSACLLSLGPFSAVSAQTTLPVAVDVKFELLRVQCRHLLDALAALKAPLPPETEKALRILLREGAPDPAAAAKIQKLLDARCLIGVSINPESRVKAARGAAVAELRLDREVIVLVKVHNEAGVTDALKVSGPQLRPGPADCWLEAVVRTKPPLRGTLSGDRVEYVILGLTAHEAGKREATFRFDVGQGTQDLGFRAEVPVLFTIVK